MQKFAAALTLAALAEAIKIHQERVDPTDIDTRPACSLGGNADKPDNSNPSEDCCRIYELPDYYGKYIDFCTTDKNAWKKIRLDNQWGRSNWKDEISSIKCGNKVRMEVCYDDTCDDKDSVGPSVSVAKPSKDNQADAVKIRAGFPEDVLTIFTQLGCNGHSRAISKLPGKETSGEKYNEWEDIGGTWNTGEFLSMWLPKGDEVEMYGDEEFETHSYTYKQNVKSQCVDLSDLPDAVFVRTEDAGHPDYGVRSLSFRTIMFPEEIV